MIAGLGNGLDPVVAGIRRGLSEIDAGARDLAGLNSPQRSSATGDVAAALVRLRTGELTTAASIKALQIESQTLGRLLDIHV
jgi:hypothetical protein